MPTFPTHQDLMYPALLALKSKGGSASNDEMLEEVIRQQKYADDIVNMPHDDGRRTKLDYRLAWARTYLKHVGAVERSGRAVWAITPFGRDLQNAQIDDLVKQVKQAQNHDKKPKRGRKNEPIEDETVSEEKWKDELLKIVRSMDPSAFERLCQRVLREYGFIKVEVTGRAGDKGIDGVGVLRIKLLSFHVAFQCKRYKDSVGSPEVRNFRGSMSAKTDKGIFITTGTYTKDAQEEAIRDGAVAIDLIDGDELCDLLEELQLGVETEMVKQCSVKPGFFASI
ncbi:restriction endonuclease [Thalassospira sp.]|uniref:restriction endonuclease n=1 Tax=Thalassospira sp. TaxID=1912094 RepID=UPI0032EE0BD7